MATDAEIRLPKFLGVKHLRDWLLKHPDGKAIAATVAKELGPIGQPPPSKEPEVSPAEWLRSTEEGRRLVAECFNERVTSKRTLVVLYGNGEVQVWTEGAVSIVNVPGDPSKTELTTDHVGLGYADLVYWPNPPDPIRKVSGRMLSDLEQALIDRTLRAWQAIEANATKVPK